MNYDFEGLIDYEIGLIRLIIEFLFGSVIKLNGNTDALNFRLVCKYFKQEIDRLSHLSIYLPIKKRKKHRGYRLPSGVSSISVITKWDSYKIIEKDWKDIFGDELDNLESSVRNLHMSGGSIGYFPKFKFLNSIVWEVAGNGSYKLLENTPHKELKIKRCLLPFQGSIAYLTKLSEIEFTLSGSYNRPISEYPINECLPPTIRCMTIKMLEYEVVDVIDLSKFTSLKCLKIVVNYKLGQLIRELILPPGVHELYSEVKIEKMNLHECKNLGVLELI